MEDRDFLHCRGTYVDAPRPNLISLALNMQPLSGLQTLSAIKSGLKLCASPVIMLSRTASLGEVRNYEAHANLLGAKANKLEQTLEISSGSRGLPDGFCPPTLLRGPKI
jgi:CheY-like chemotaxis protein